ncbi:hypothetical protein ACKS0A_05238 [Histoplasma ohiense]
MAIIGVCPASLTRFSSGSPNSDSASCAGFLVSTNLGSRARFRDGDTASEGEVEEVLVRISGLRAVDLRVIPSKLLSTNSMGTPTAAYRSTGRVVRDRASSSEGANSGPWLLLLECIELRGLCSSSPCQNTLVGLRVGLDPSHT